VLETFGILAISDMPVAIEYLVTSSAIVFRQQKRQIAALFGDQRDVLAAAEPFKIVKIDPRNRRECVDDVHLQVMTEKDRCVTAGRWPATERLPNMR
jgi:hypothetical protein